MSDETKNSQSEDAAIEAAELEALKNQAKQLGVQFHPNIKAEKLREKIKDAAAKPDDESRPEVNDTPDPQAKKTVTKRDHLQAAGRLRRVRITCMNPAKSEWEGEIFTAGNSVVGNFRKYVPFEKEWHVPQIILNMIEDRKYQTFYTIKDKRTGQRGRKGKIVKEFSIEILPDLDEKELKSLAQRQAMANGTAEA